MNIDIARTLANINSRAETICADYHATILIDEVLVTRKDDGKRSYTVRDGACTCPSFKHHGTCKHSLGIVDLVETEVARLVELCTVYDSPYIPRAVANGREIAEAARCEMSIGLYRECCRRAEELEAA